MFSFDRLSKIFSYVKKHGPLDWQGVVAIPELNSPLFGRQQLLEGLNVLIDYGFLVKKDNKYAVIADSFSDNKLIENICLEIMRSSSLPLDGIAEITTNGQVEYWIAYSSPNFRRIVHFLDDANMIKVDNVRRRYIFPASSQIAGLLIDVVRGPGRRKTLEKLLEELENKRKLGEKAEKIALEFENKRLSKLGISHQAKIVSSDYVNAGYDIESYNEQHHIPNRFIEVKAISEDGHFYMSANEVSTAKKYATKYHLYLVTVGARSENSPIEIITNPYHELFEKENADWLKSVASYFFQKI